MRPPPSSTLFPYTTLFRSSAQRDLLFVGASLRDTRACYRREPGWDESYSHRNCDWFSVGSAAAGSHSLLRRVDPEEHTSELQSPVHLVCRLLLEKKNTHKQ